MKHEILRFARVTYEEKGEIYLKDFEISIMKGEIAGLLPLNAYGLTAFLSLLRYNHPLYYGRVYYMGKLVNSWQDMHRSYNKITVISSESSLVTGQSVLTNIFVLRPGFGQYFIRKGMLKKQLQPFLDDIGTDISPDTAVETLSGYDRVVVEILRAVVAGHRLIVLQEVETFVSEHDIEQLYAIIKHYSKRGITFLYISTHFEEIRRICDRVCVMSNGKILSVLDQENMDYRTEELLYFGYADHVIKSLYRQRSDTAGRTVLHVRDMMFPGIADRDFYVRKGEYLVVRPLDHKIFDSIVSMVFDGRTDDSKGFYMDGKKIDLAATRRAALIGERPDENMLFPDMSYLENLLFTADHKIPHLWMSKGIKKSVKQEMSYITGEEVFEKSVRSLTQREKIELVYERVMLQKPDVVICVSPFKGEDFTMRMLILELQAMLISKGIAIVTITMNMADSLSLADRVVQIDADLGAMEYSRDEFGSFPDDVPWSRVFQRRGESIMTHPDM